MAPQHPRDMRDYMQTLERLTVQQRAMPALISGAINEAKEEGKVETARHPAAPVEISVQSAVYFEPSLGRHRARLDLDFPDVTFNTDGTAATIQHYELWGRDETNLSPESLADETPWEIRSTSAESFFRAEGYLPGRRWRFRLRAIGADSILPGEWSEDFVQLMAKDTTPPPQPTAPTVESDRGQLTVKWDGRAVSGDMPADFSHAILAHGTASSPTTEVYRFGSGAGFTVITGAAYNTAQFFRLRAVDESGNLSPWSEQATGMTKPLVDVDVILSELDAGKTVIKNAGEIMLDVNTTLSTRLAETDLTLSTMIGTTIPELAASVNGKNSIYRKLVAPTADDPGAEGDRWEVWSSLSTGGRLRETYRRTGSSTWLQESIDPTYLPLVDIGQGTFGSLAGGRLEANTVSLRELLVGSFSNLLENGSFEYGTKNWPTTTNWSIEATGGRVAPGCMKVTGITARHFGPVSGSRIVHEAGDTYRLSGWVRTTATTGHRGELCFYWYAANGAFISNKNFMIPDATSEWQYYSFLHAPPATAASFSVRPVVTMANAADEYYFDDLAVVKASDGSLVVDGSITGDKVDANSVAAKIGMFLKLYSNQLIIGQPNNVLPDPMFTDAGMLALRNQWSTVTVAMRDKDYELNNTTTGLQYFRPLGVQQSAAGVATGAWIPVTPGEIWEWTATVVGVKATGGWIKFVGRTKDGSAYANPTASTSMAVGSGTYTVRATVPANCYWIMPEMACPVGVMLVTVGTMRMRQVIDDSLIVDGGIYTRHLTVTEDMTVALLKAHKVLAAEIDVNSLKADTAFVGAMNAIVVTANMFSGKTFTGGTFTGALVRTAASGARTEVTTQGIRQLDAAGVELLRIGYGISTGMSIRNPGNGTLAPVSNMVFGGFTWAATSRVSVALAANEMPWKNTSVVQTMGYVATSDTVVMLASADMWVSMASEPVLTVKPARGRVHCKLVPRKAGVAAPTLRGSGYAELTTYMVINDTTNDRTGTSWNCWFEGLVPGEIYDMQIWLAIGARMRVLVPTWAGPIVAIDVQDAMNAFTAHVQPSVILLPR